MKIIFEAFYYIVVIYAIICSFIGLYISYRFIIFGGTISVSKRGKEEDTKIFIRFNNITKQLNRFKNERNRKSKK